MSVEIANRFNHERGFFQIGPFPLFRVLNDGRTMVEGVDDLGFVKIRYRGFGRGNSADVEFEGMTKREAGNYLDDAERLYGDHYFDKGAIIRQLRTRLKEIYTKK